MKSLFEDSRRGQRLRLLLFGLVGPLLCECVFSTGGQIARYYGNYHGYETAGSWLLLTAEIASILYQIVSLCCFAAAAMTVFSIAAAQEVRRGISFWGLLCAFRGATGLFRIASYALLLLLGLSDSTLPVSQQVLPGLLTFLSEWALLSILMLLAFFLFVRIGKKSDKRFESANTPFMKANYFCTAAYTLALLLNELPVALSYRPQEENVITGVILPLFYPLLYGALMLLTVLYVRDRLSKSDPALNASSDGEAL